MSAGLVRQLQDGEVQEQLIALGVLDAMVGKASRNELRQAVAWFRKSTKSTRGMAPLDATELEKLKQAKAAFYAVTGLKQITYDDSNPQTSTDLQLLVPTKFVSETPKTSRGFDDRWKEYHSADEKVSVGPVLHTLADFTPISLFRQNIMDAPLRYKQLHLTADEFIARGEANDAEGGYISANLVQRSNDKLQGVLMRYPKKPPAAFTDVPELLRPVIASEPQPAAEGSPSDPVAKSWLLVMQSVSNLVMSEFPKNNGWKAVDTKPCTLKQDEPAGSPRSIRILFGTDRKLNTLAKQQGGAISDPDTLFGNEPGNLLTFGCAYVQTTAKDGVPDPTASKITEYKWLHSTPFTDTGEQLYMVNELAENQQARTRSRGLAERRRVNATSGVASSALVFIHGYNVAFKDALFSVAQTVSDIGYEGRVYMYSWPSAASTIGYIADLDRAEQAEPYLQTFLRLLLRDADLDYVDVLVHSMGSQPAMRALSSLQSLFETERPGLDRPTRIRLGQIMLAAPDIARPVFEQKIRRIAPHANRVTVYASSTDGALYLSQVLRRGALRTGEIDGTNEPQLVEIKNVHIIDSTGPVDWWRLAMGYGHDYFQSGGVQADIKNILMSTGDKEFLTPDMRSPALFSKSEYKAAKDWFYWKLRTPVPNTTTVPKK